MIDTLKYTRELESAGLDPHQAEKIVRAQIDMITTSVATRADLKVLEARMDVEFAEIRNQFKDVYRRFEDIDRKFKAVNLQLKQLEDRITYKLTGVMVLLLSIFTAANKLF